MEPIDFVCTIDPAGLKQRVDQLESLVQQVLTRRRDGLTLALEFPAEAAQDVRAFVVEESRCCPFFSFEVDEIDQRLRLAIRTPPGGEAMLDALHATFAGDGTKLRARFEAGTYSPRRLVHETRHVDEPASVDTLTIHAGTEPGTLSVPIHQAAVYPFPGVERARAIHEGEEPGYFYGRLGHPTQHALEEAIRALEGGEAALATSSGMAAIAVTVLSSLRRGEHVVAPSAIYPTAHSLFKHLDAEFGIEVTFIADTAVSTYAAAIRTNTRLLYVESPANPALSVTDIEGVSQLGHDRGLLVAVDNTVASPLNQRPLLLGADVVVHSATKYLGGHGDVLGGLIVGPAAPLHRARWQIAKLFGPTIDPFGAWLILRGVRTLGVRMARHNENGLSVAGFLEQHPAVRRVNYPGLATHPQHELAARQMRGFSGLLSFELASADEAQRFLSATRLSTLAVSFGDVATLVQHPASMTGAGLTDAERAAGGMTDGLIRLSVGLEDQKDLIQDLSAALEMAHITAE